MARSDIKTVELTDIAPGQVQGVYAGKITDITIDNNVLTYHLKDIFNTDKNITIDIEIGEEEVFTSKGREVWINSVGQIGYGPEDGLFNNFKYFTRATWNATYTEVIREDILSDKKYWRARKGEQIVTDLITCSLDVNPYDNRFDITNGKEDWFKKVIDTDLRYLRDLKTDDFGIKKRIGGIMYAAEEQGVFTPFCSASLVPDLIKHKGKIPIEKDYHTKRFMKAVAYGVPGYFEWDYLTEVKENTIKFQYKKQ